MTIRTAVRNTARWLAGSGQIRQQARRLPEMPEERPRVHYRAEAQPAPDLLASYDGGEYQIPDRELEAG